MDVSSTNDIDLSKFTVIRVLYQDPEYKSICVEGLLKDKKGIAVLILEQKGILSSDVPSICKKCHLRETLTNDIYRNYDLFPANNFGLKATLIHPASDLLIKKYERRPFYLIEETAHLYNTVTLPSITSQQLDLKWVYNILNGSSEKDRVIYRDNTPNTGFVLIKDMKWDGTDVKKLHFIALPMTHGQDIKSIRDLTDEHLPLLHNISKATKIIKAYYGVNKDKLRAYFHYQPSFYHLHVHFTNIDGSESGDSSDRVHNLNDVVYNLSVSKTYYRDCPLRFAVKEGQPLYNAYKAIGLVETQ